MNNHLALRSYGGETAIHSHDHHQIVLPDHGALALEIGGWGGLVATGRGAFIPAGTPHAFAASGGTNRFVVIDLGPGALSERVERLDTIPFFTPPPKVRGLIDYLTAALGTGGSLSIQACEAWCHLLADSLDGRSPKPTGQPIVARALAFMAAHLGQTLTIAAIAAAAGASESRLHRLFRAETGMTPHARLLTLRLDAAIDRLTTTRQPIADIALSTGFGDQSALTRRLRQARGVTPAALRRGDVPGKA